MRQYFLRFCVHRKQSRAGEQLKRAVIRALGFKLSNVVVVGVTIAALMICAVIGAVYVKVG